MTDGLALGLAALLQPIDDTTRSGQDLQYDPLYSSIRLARQVDQNALPAGVWTRHDRKKIDWAQQAQHCIDVLSQRSKDLQVAAWLTEALAHQHRLTGFAQGLALFVDLVELFWDDVHPQLESQDAAMRLRPVHWLLREIARWIHNALLETDDSTESDPALRAARHAGWQQVEADLLRMDAFLESQVGLQVPSFRDVLELVKKCRQSEQLAGPAEAEPSSPPGLNAAADAVRPTALTSRDQAYDQLHQIALLLARIEPHSPVPSVLQALVQWRHARFEELLERLPQDGPSVYELLRLFKSAPAR